MSDYLEGKSRWWGWGELGRAFDLEKHADFLPFLRESLEMPLERDRFAAPSLEEVDLPPSRLGEDALRELREACGRGNVATDRFHRVSHSMGKSYRDALRMRMRRVQRPVDAVVWPRGEDDIAAVLRLAEERGLEVIPFGGGSSVTGGVEPRGEGEGGAISLDLAQLNRVLRVDATSQTAVIEAGALGPEIEEQLNAHGYTLGHFPGSFEHSSLGGWAATRSSGRRSTAYGGIEDMVLALRMVTPRGLIDTRRVPRAATGPSILQLCMGSEGILGVITAATVKVRPAPIASDYRGLIFRNFAAGVSAVREMMQQGMAPTCVHLCDRTETALAGSLRYGAGGKWRRRGEDAVLGVLARRGYSMDDGALMLLGLEGERGETEYLRVEILRLCRRLGGCHLGTVPGRQWQHIRCDMPYLRERLIDRGVLVGGIETATTWDNLLRLYGEVRSALRGVLEEGGGKGMVACRVSHADRQGASLCYTVLAPMAERGCEEEQWEGIRRAALEAVLEYGGTISHHHGVGCEHLPWMPGEVGETALEAIRAVKEAVDPLGVLNPGKLIPPR